MDGNNYDKTPCHSDRLRGDEEGQGKLGMQGKQGGAGEAGDAGEAGEAGEQDYGTNSRYSLSPLHPAPFPLASSSQWPTTNDY